MNYEVYYGGKHYSVPEIANLKPLSADGRFNHHHNYKERRSIACPCAEKSAPVFRKLSDFV